MRMQIGEVIDLRNCRAERLLYSDKVRDDQVDLVWTDAANLASGCIIKQFRWCQCHVRHPLLLLLILRSRFVAEAQTFSSTKRMCRHAHRNQTIAARVL